MCRWERLPARLVLHLGGQRLPRPGAVRLGLRLFHDLPNGSPAYSAEPHADWHAVWFLRNNC
ncbi:hypothetical protein ACFPN7_11685 [Amycolatopsis halotolerans]|uniref:hypothetical protein n=1 Tax=Amycolatopsis halotolerans TaxID=330083 RepID=UPI0036146B3B